jgi:phosphotransferase system enzyme I (PtsP)
LAEVPDGRLIGIVSGSGSVNAHVAILARALGVPTILGVAGLPIAEIDKTELIIDGSHGDVYVAASLQLQRELLQLQAQEQRDKEHLQAIRDLPAETLDGHCVSLRVNVGLAINRGSSLRINAEGVGLFRSEVAFMGRDRFPAEEEQRVIYRQLLSAFAPRPVVMRTLDVGSDKPLPYFAVEEENPALGWRGIRITLDHPEVFLVQIRAMLRASEGLDNLHLLLPMISTPSEIDESIRLIHRALDELREEGYHITLPPIGAMIEVPSAVYQAKDIVKRVDFLSVGSNDLVQYLLAVDRNNAHVAHLYQALHPVVLQALKITVDAAKAAGKWVSICGEMVSDPLAVPLLVALGFDCLSTHSVSLLQVKSVIRNMNLKQWQDILTQVLAMEEVAQVRALLEKRQ